VAPAAFARPQAVQHEVALKGTPAAPASRKVLASVVSTLKKEHSMSYVDGFLVPVRKRDLATYRRMAKTAGKVWREHGALEFRESIADDVSWGKRTSFPRSVKQKNGETVFFSYIVYKSRADRDRINAKVMKASGLQR
jgi:uncharacterized protein YbaA (DUF1428 family)